MAQRQFMKQLVKLLEQHSATLLAVGDGAFYEDEQQINIRVEIDGEQYDLPDIRQGDSEDKIGTKRPKPARKKVKKKKAGR